MDRNKPRPVYLNLLQIHLPIGGIISILHRISGILLVLGLPVFLYILGQTLEGNESFIKITDLLSTMMGKVLLLAWGGFLAQHFFSGLRHLFMDLDIGVDKESAQKSAWAVPVMTTVFLITWGIVLW